MICERLAGGTLVQCPGCGEDHPLNGIGFIEGDGYVWCDEEQHNWRVADKGVLIPGLFERLEVGRREFTEYVRAQEAMPLQASAHFDAAEQPGLFDAFDRDLVASMFPDQSLQNDDPDEDSEDE